MQALLIDMGKAVEVAGGVWHRMRLNGGACNIDDYSKKQNWNAHRPMKVSARENGADSNDRKPETCWSDYANSSPNVLHFMTVESVPFTNTRVRTICAESAPRSALSMTKVQQKISGCFRSMEGAKIFCLVRSYLSTCRKRGLSATQALTLLFQGKNPDFMERDEA